jgi:hypothetical protein
LLALDTSFKTHPPVTEKMLNERLRDTVAGLASRADIDEKISQTTMEFAKKTEIGELRS